MPLLTPALISGLHIGEFTPPLIATIVYLYLYALRTRALHREGRPVANWRILSFEPNGPPAP